MRRILPFLRTTKGNFPYGRSSLKKLITGWRVINTASIAQRYNGGGDDSYQAKLDCAIGLIKGGTPVAAR